MSKIHFAAVGAGILIGVVFAGKIRSLPLVSKLPSF